MMATAAQIFHRWRCAMPRWISPSSWSATSARPADAMQPASTSDQFCVCNPAKMRSPRLVCPTVVASVAMPMVQTAAVRMPAMIVGAANGACTQSSFCRRVMPTPSAASVIAGSTPVSPVTALRMIGSNA